MLQFSNLSQLKGVEHGITEKGEKTPEGIVQGEQVHRNKTVWVGADSEPIVRGADALLTKETGVTLAVRVADCLPILIADQRTGIIGTIHAGWRGTALEVARKAVEHMKIHPNKLIVGIGPGICAKCFEVGEEVARQFDPTVVHPSQEDESKFFLDLAQTNILQLIDAGVPQKNIETMNQCTLESDSLFSFRGGDREERDFAFIRRV